MSWSRIQDSQLAADAKAEYDKDVRRAFHNWGHVENLYWAAEHVYGFEYDADLDKAILAHDVIYDEHPRKELRSAKWLLDHCLEDGIERAFNHIMRTAHPSVTSDNRMILLDYARLRDGKLILPDRGKLLAETTSLNGIGEFAFAKGNIAYFSSVIPRFSDEHLKRLPKWEKDAFQEIRSGMEFLVNYSRMILADAA